MKPPHLDNCPHTLTILARRGVGAAISASDRAATREDDAHSPLSPACRKPDHATV